VSTAGWLLIVSGCAVLLIAAIGLFRLSDAVSRQHAATKAGTLGLGLILSGAPLVGGDWTWAGRALLIMAILFATLPVASHMLARAAARRQFSAEEMAGAPLYPHPHQCDSHDVRD
jgi:multicomponent Na+:H+ antiporter subunit G